jgi:hypothetical protein
MAEFDRVLGAAPSISLGGHAGCNDPRDWAALRELAEHIAACLGGWVIERGTCETIDSTLRECCGDLDIREIHARDVKGYFGTEAPNAEYLREYESYVPQMRFCVMDAKRCGQWTVRK